MTQLAVEGEIESWAACILEKSLTGFALLIAFSLIFLTAAYILKKKTKIDRWDIHRLDVLVTRRELTFILLTQLWSNGRLSRRMDELQRRSDHCLRMADGPCLLGWMLVLPLHNGRQ